jgi:DNA-binding transcriptional LysR family regulator
MNHPDLNLLVTLDVLLAEGSVARAARRLRLSPSAMSRTLARLRAATGDPLLVRAGRGLVPTPRALELAGRVGDVVREGAAMLSPATLPDLRRLERVFTLRTRDGFAENFGPALLARLAKEAPGVRLHFVTKADRDSGPLRAGDVDLETGVVGARLGPELRTQALFRDRWVAVAASGRGRMSLADFLARRHVAIARPRAGLVPVDAALAARGLKREVAVVVDTFSSALALVRASELVAVVPERHTGRLRDGLVSFPLPVSVPAFALSLLWHPRFDADPAHRWLRGCVREICAD